MEGDPEMHVPHWLPWDAKARLMLAYAAECRSVVAGLSDEGLYGWALEAKKAERKAKSFLRIQQVKPDPPAPRPADGKEFS